MWPWVFYYSKPHEYPEDFHTQNASLRNCQSYYEKCMVTWTLYKGIKYDVEANTWN